LAVDAHVRQTGWKAPLNGAGVDRLAEEQAALRRVATLVARAVPAGELFRAVVEEVGRVLSVENVHLLRYGPDDAATVLASFGRTYGVLPAGARMKLGGRNVTTLVFETGRSARIDDYGDASGPFAVGAREHGVRSSVATPIVVEGAMWGVMVVGCFEEQTLPADTEARLASFTELVGTAVANAESRAGLARLAEEQAALRRVATLVAHGTPPEEVFAAVVEEVGRLLSGVSVDYAGMARYEPDGGLTVLATAGRAGFVPIGTRLTPGELKLGTIVFETGRPARVDDYADASGPFGIALHEMGVRSAIAAPIIIEDRLWGVVAAGSTLGQPLPVGTETRLASFSELLATAIANAESRAGLARLAEEQAALRRIATLVARGQPPEEVFAAVAREVERLLDAEMTNLARYDPDGAFAVVASSGIGLLAVGSRWPVGGKNLATLVFETAGPARLDNYVEASGAHIDGARPVGLRSSVGVPIILEGRLWGIIGVATTQAEPLPADTEARLRSFTELVATAIANAESGAGRDRLAAEQEALRRVATLVARGVPPEEVFASVTEEVARLFRTDGSHLRRFESDGTYTVLASGGKPLLPIGSRWPIGGKNPTTTIFETGRPARIDNYNTNATGELADHIREVGVRSAVGTPVIVEGHVWGVVGVGSNRDALPPDTEERLAAFTELVATAIANTESRAGLARLAEEQAALRRVATLVAEGAAPAAVFDAVAAEMATLLDADGITLVRYESDDELTVLAHHGSAAQQVPAGSRIRHDGASVTATVRRTQRPARMESYADTHGQIGEVIGDLRYRSGVGAPIVVDGRLWGATIANWTGEEPPPPGTEDRLAQFARLPDTAIANADSRDQLTASRARLVTEALEARRGVVRDLHDGGQRLLVHTIIKLKLARRALDENKPDAAPLLSEALEHAESANDELRELSHGQLPSVLTREGLRAGVVELVATASIPVEIDVRVGRLPAVVEATAYFFVAEALTNVVKHARAERAQVRAFVQDDTLHVEVRDDGVGGANPSGGGLVGLRDRVTALRGRLCIQSSAQGGTILVATLPLDPE
jgi:GAF domain-containing protein